jgi:hypothetical protein
MATTGQAQAVLAVDPPAVVFGDVAVGDTATSAIAVTNVGGARAGSIQVSASAGLTAEGCTVALDPGAACVLTLSVSGAEPGPFSGTVDIVATPGTTTPLRVLLRAKFVEVRLSAEPPTLDFGELPLGASSPAQTVTVRNVGDIESQILRTDQIGAIRAFKIVESTCIGTLPRGASCTLDVVFSPIRTGSDTSVYTLSAGSAVVSLPMIGVGI